MSALASLLRSGEFVVTAELNPPKSAAANVVRRRGEALKGVVDAVNVTDSNRAMVAMAAIPAATIVRSSGVEPIVQITGRDRNRIALQADVLGAVAMGIEMPASGARSENPASCSTASYEPGSVLLAT